MPTVAPRNNGQEGKAPPKGPGAELDPRQLLRALSALKRGDFTARLPEDTDGLGGKIADTFNEVVDLNQRLAAELERLSRVVGKEGKLGQRGTLGEATGA